MKNVRRSLLYNNYKLTKSGNKRGITNTQIKVAKQGGTFQLKYSHLAFPFQNDPFVNTLLLPDFVNLCCL